MEQSIGATYLRQRLTDVLQAVREQRQAFVIEVFGRPQAALVNLNEYREFQRFRQEREAFFERLDAMSAQNAARNAWLEDEEILAIIEQAREQVASGME